MNVHEAKSFSVTPKKVKVGGTVKVKGSPHDKLHVLHPNGTRTTLRLDIEGKADLKEPIGDEGYFSITDADPRDPHTVEVDVYI